MNVHTDTRRLLMAMYDPKELQRVMEQIVLEILTEKNRNRYPFMALQFGKDPLGDVRIGHPPDTYRWN